MLSSLMFAVIWRPAGPPLYIYAGAAALAALAMAVYLRTFNIRPVLSLFLLIMRLLIVLATAVLLMGPSEIPRQIQQQIRPKLSILLDTSQSMLTTDCGQGSRMHFAIENWLSNSQFETLSQNYEIELFGFDRQVRPLSRAALESDEVALATGGITRIGDCVTQALQKMQTSSQGQAMLLISDGHESEDGSIQPAAVLAKSRNTPIHTVCLGGNTMQRDVALLAAPMQDYLLADEPGEIMVKVYQAGLDRASTTVDVQCGNERTQLSVDFNGRRMVELRVPIRQAEAGQYEYHVRVRSIEGEIETNNNEQSVFCDVTRERIRVLVLEGQPFWDTKFLAQSLRKDERIELTQVTQLSSMKQETITTRVKQDDGSPRVPTNAQEMAKYDVIILGRQLENLLNASTAALLKDYVARQGGHVIFARGIAYDPNTSKGASIGEALAELEPVNWGRQTLSDLSLSLSPGGENSPWFSTSKMGVDVEQAIARLPGFQRMTKVEREKAATVVLLRARPIDSPPGGADDGDPALVSMMYGRGSIVGILGEGLWKWSLLEKDKRDLAGFYDLFWSNLVRWLAMGGDFQPGQQVSLKLGRSSVYLGDPITIDAVFKIAPAANEHPTFLITDASGNTESLLLNRVPGRDPRFRATFNPMIAGVYRVTLNTPNLTPDKQERGFSVHDVSLERLETSANPMTLRVLSDHTGGATFKPNEADRLVDKLQRKMLATIVPNDPEYIWDSGMILFLMLTWAGLEWIIRRKAGWL